MFLPTELLELLSRGAVGKLYITRPASAYSYMYIVLSLMLVCCYTNSTVTAVVGKRTIAYLPLCVLACPREEEEEARSPGVCWRNNIHVVMETSETL